MVNYEDRSDTQDEQHWYQVHYLGWSKKWDEWVPEKFVMEYNEDTCHKQADLYKKYQVRGDVMLISITVVHARMSEKLRRRNETSKLRP